MTGKLLFAADGRIECAGECLSTWGMPYSRGRGEPDSGQYEVTEQVFAGSGGSMLLSAAMLGDVGVFDETLFAYLEDIDLSFRARLRGWEVWYAPSAVVRHAVGATSSRVPGFTYRQTLRNMVLVYLKDMPASLAWRHLPRFAAEWWLIAASGLRRGQVRAFAAAVAGVARLWLPTWRERRRVQARRTVRPAALARQLTPGLVPGQLDAIAGSVPFLRRVRAGGPPRPAR